jgi:hypothetical protein
MGGEALRFDPSTPEHTAECDLRHRLIRPGLVKEAELGSVGKSADARIGTTLANVGLSDVGEIAQDTR